MRSMHFERRPAKRWQEEIPGTRWFKVDLHVHTVDDHPGGRARLPDGLSGDVTDPELLTRYARCFLQASVANGVQVIGLTPHSPRAGTTPETSAVWKIVDEWNDGDDDDGVPFREKIFAVFPGFEPNVNDGSTGIHLLFLFDPEIGRDPYLSLYDAIMDARVPWEHSALRLTSRDANAIFATLDQRQSESDGSATPWRYIALAPHFQREHGVFREMRSKTLERFPCHRLSGYELGDDALPNDLDHRKKPGRFLLPFMEEHRQAFFHASDACSTEELGRRHTWMKLASPRVDSLRQAFIASDSRTRIAFERHGEGGLRPLRDAPDASSSTRPWLKSLSIRGTGSFFGIRGGGTSTIRLSPDLTCIIGGSMTGKSTLLDGLRVHIDAPLPKDRVIRDQVEARGRSVFGAGSPDVELECPGREPTAPLLERWQAHFFAQNELQHLSLEVSSVETILAGLVPSETPGIDERNRELLDLDERLREVAQQLTRLDDSLAEAEQACQRARSAKQALAVFSEAGVAGLHQAGRDRQRWREVKGGAESVRADVHRLVLSVSTLDIPEAEEGLASGPVPEELDPIGMDLDRRWKRLDEHIRLVEREMGDWIGDVTRLVGFLEEREDSLRAGVERALAERGPDAAKLRELQGLNRQASLLPSYEANLDRTRERLVESETRYCRLKEERELLVGEQRAAFDRVVGEVERGFSGRIRARRIDDGDYRPLDAFLRALRQKGVTRWWNDLSEDDRPSPQILSEYLGKVPDASQWNRSEESVPDDVIDVDGIFDPVEIIDRWGMSDAVRATFRECMTRSRRRELDILRCPDRYLLELRMDNGSYRRLDTLSGGQRVSVLLSLLLETRGSSPLVIDQPEDELDNRFLFETVLPALKKLKGRRQVVLATHNANIVVNGDADMVIQLEATANRGRVALAGAIEEPAVRDAIVRTVDGGEEAFRLRRHKYGF